jgi:hypothetical protein
MAYTKLSKEGEAFIKYYCKGTGKLHLEGKGIDLNGGALPYQYQGTGKPQLSPNYLWQTTAYYNNKLIQTDEELGVALISWYNKYASMYQIDANIIAAQGFAESAYNIWVFPLTSDASGISQFTIDTMITIILQGAYNVEPKFSEEEKAKIFDVNIEGTKRQPLTYQVTNADGSANLVGRQNRATLHQNTINNPDILIKAQCRLLKVLANNCDSLAIWTLFGYAAGSKYTKINPKWNVKSFSDAVQLAKKDGNRHAEGVAYIFKIFYLLGDKDNVNLQIKQKGYWFGYGPDKLFGLDPKSGINMSVKLADQLKLFDAVAVNIKNTNNLYN